MFEYHGEQSLEKRALASAFTVLVMAFSLTASCSIFTTIALQLIFKNFGNSIQFYGALIITLIVFSIGALFLASFTAKTATSSFSQTIKHLRKLLIDTGHDLTTPLAVAQSRIQLLEKTHTFEDEDLGDWRAIKSALSDQVALIKDLRLLANTETMSERAEMEFVSLNELTREAVEDLEAHATTRNLTISIEQSTTIAVVGDRNGLKRVLANLLINALRYSKEGSTIKIKILTEEENATVSILSQGPAIPEKDIPHLFDRYYAKEGHKQREGIRSGLGLAIVKAIVDAHGGKVKVETSENSGNNFVFSIPKIPGRHPALSLIE
ncbi:MAG: HAMP domain-containing histidine kinase [Cyanobacteria bacterium REEB67]|nr:HAMP domain-containing histidine kinase [Cyanobacteria bacterium REEB67]